MSKEVFKVGHRLIEIFKSLVGSGATRGTKGEVKQPKSKWMPQVIQNTAWITNKCVELDQVCFRGETPRESDWGCQVIPWLLYTIILYIHVCIGSINIVYERHIKIGEHETTTWWWQNGREAWYAWCTCVWQHSHAQHGNELSRISLSLMV